MVQKLILIRHAHRDKPSLSEQNQNNGLSDKGRKQAKALADYWRKKLGGNQESGKILFLSSPKKRCVETLQGLADVESAKIKILDSLDESNTQKELRLRVQAFENLWHSSDASIIVACSHGDWIPAFTEKVLGESIDLDKAGWIEVIKEIKHEIRLEKVIQKLS